METIQLICWYGLTALLVVLIALCVYRIIKGYRKDWFTTTGAYKRGLQVFFVLLIIAILGFLWEFPKRKVLPYKDKMTPKELIELENDVRRSWAQFFGIIGGLGILYFWWRRVTAMDRAVEVSYQGQVTERFTRAIDQLGAIDDKGQRKLEIRVGGIYALERIARESASDHWPIMEILTTYVRENSPTIPVEGERRLTNAKVGVSADIQAILTVLGRRIQTYKAGESQRLDLGHTYLEHANLERAKFRGIRLQESDLNYANLLKTDFKDADLSSTYFIGANVKRTNFRDAILSDTYLEGVKGLTAEKLAKELCKAKTLYKAVLDPEVEKQIKKDCPHLLEKQSEE